MEEWKQIVIDDEVYDYEVSTEGRVRNMKTGKILKPKKNNYDYLQVTLYYKGQQRIKQVHRLVMETFKPTDDKTLEVNHKNYNRGNNRLENLEYLKHKNNIIYSKAKKVKCIETGIIYESTNEASRQTGLAQASICNCCNGKRKSCGGLHWEYV